MVLPGHIAGGYISTYILLKLSPVVFSFSQKEILILYIISIIASEAPDIDLFFTDVTRPDKNHRDFITHKPIFWLMISGLIILLGIFTNSLFISYIGLIILTSSWTHFILDSIEYGICWFWPISKKRFSILKEKYNDTETNPRRTKKNLSYYWKYVSGEYLRSIVFYLEIFIMTIAIIIFFFSTDIAYPYH